MARTDKPAETIFTLLKAEHRWVARQLRELGELLDDDERDDDACAELFRQIAGGLLAHAKAEEQVVYPAFARAAKEPVAEAHEEHALVELLIRQVLARDELDDAWKAKVKVLTDLVAHHVKEEEGPVFRAAQRAIRGPRARELADEFRAAKTAAMAKPPSPRRARADGAARVH